MQDRQVLPDRPLRLSLGQYVVGQSEATRREQLLAIAIVRKRTRLSHQPVDHVTVFDPVLAAATQTRQQLHPMLGVPHLDPIRIQTGLHPLADQPAGHRVGVAPNVDRAAPVHPHTQPLTRLQPTRRQCLQQRQLLQQTLPPARIELLEELTQECLILHATGEVPAAA